MPELRLSLAVMDGEKKKVKLSFGYLILGLWAVLLVQQLLSAYLRPTRISYSDFKVAVAQSKVEEAAIGKTLIQGRMKEAAAAPEATPSQQQQPTPQQQSQQQQKQPEQQPPTPTTPGPLAPKPEADGKGRMGFETVRVDDPDLLKELAARGVRVNGVVESTFWRDAAGWLIPIALIGVFWMLMIRRLGQAGQNGFMTLGRSKAKVYMEKDVNVRLRRRRRRRRGEGGAARRSIDFLKTPEKFGRLGGQHPQGRSARRPARHGQDAAGARGRRRGGRAVLLASAAPTSSRCSSASAPRASATCSSRRKQQAPCIIFIDELDALGQGARRRARSAPRRARADAEPAARRDGRLRLRASASS